MNTKYIHKVINNIQNVATVEANTVVQLAGCYLEKFIIISYFIIYF